MHNAAMRIFALADLHLSSSGEKPMDVFGEHWVDHARRMADAWDGVVEEGDVVLCPGDLSWATRLDEAAPDLAWIGARRGRKVLGKGNHDHWWSSITKVRAALPEGCSALQNDAVDLGPAVVAGARGWDVPGSEGFGDEDEKIYRRELGRLRRSLEEGYRLAEDRPLISALHYPPFAPDGTPTGFTELLDEFAVEVCVYGHLHGPEAHATAVVGCVGGVRYHCVAADYVDFRPVPVWPGYTACRSG